ncbi:MAG: hypothetical protein KFW09_05740 [Oscillospiraceae bacterium]|nr:hypothetical protein [Oscillospiraceae bacterium]
MKNNFMFEFNKINYGSLHILLSAFYVQLFFLYFFTVIGRFEPDDILQNYSSIIGLASTITTCTLVVIGTIFINRRVVYDFIGDSKIRLYLYPDGRNSLFIRKIYGFFLVYGIKILLGSLISNILYFSIECIFPILLSTKHISNAFPMIIISTLTISLLTTIFIVLSACIGIYFSSMVATIVSGIIFVTIFGNLIAISFIYNPYILFAVLSGAIFVVIIVVKIISSKIKKEDVIYK